jgi:lipopolysaccharide transport system permease protein
MSDAIVIEIGRMPRTAPELVLEAGRGETQYWRDLWEYRELFYFLAWRDVCVRYKQSALGIGWAVIRPTLTMVVFTIVFSRLAKLSAPGAVPYALLVMSAMLAWQFFATALADSSNSLISNANLISKVYFPRILVPAAAVGTSFVDFAITLTVTGGLMVWFHFMPDWHVLALPFFVLLACAASFGVGLWFAALNVEYRDVRHIVPFIVQFGLYVSPVGFNSGIVPEPWRIVYALNPMVGVIDGFRWSLLRGNVPLAWTTVVCSIVVTVVLCATAIAFFRSVEKSFADVI